MRQIFKVLMISFFAVNAYAVEPEFAVSVGFRSFNADFDGTGASVSGKAGLQAGVLGFVPFTDLVQIRTGFLYSQRNLTIEGTPVSTDANTSWVDIPATLFLKFSEFGGVFFGPVISMNLSKECSNSDGAACSVTGLSSTSMPLSLGVSFKFAPQMGGELVYETQSGKFADSVKDARAIGVNFNYFFE